MQPKAMMGRGAKQELRTGLKEVRQYSFLHFTSKLELQKGSWELCNSQRYREVRMIG